MNATSLALNMQSATKTIIISFIMRPSE